MEFRHHGLSTTFVSLSDGTASLYFSSGGCVIGGGTHPLVGRAASELLTMAQQFRFQMATATGMPPPSPDHVRFYLLTLTGNVTAEGLEEDLLRGKDRLAPLFHKVHEVITQIRIASEMQGTSSGNFN
jgi:hypothetical protein